MPEPPGPPPIQPPQSPPLPPKGGGDDVLALVKEMLRRDDMKPVRSSKPQEDDRSDLARAVRAVEQLIAASKRPEKRTFSVPEALKKLVDEMADEVREAAKAFAKSAPKRRRGVVRTAKTGGERARNEAFSRSENVDRAIQAASHEWAQYARRSSASIGAVDAAISKHRREVEGMALRSWMPRALDAAKEEIAKFGRSWDAASFKAAEALETTREELSSLQAGFASSAHEGARVAVSSADKIDRAFAAAAASSEEFSLVFPAAMEQISQALATASESIDATLGTGMSEKLQGAISRAVSGGVSELLELSKVASKIGRDVIVTIDGQEVSFASAISRALHGALREVDPSVYVDMKLGKFDDLGRLIETSRNAGETASKSFLERFNAGMNHIWDIIRSPSLIATGLFGAVAGGQLIEVTNQQSAAGKLLGSVLGDLNAKNALAQRSTEVLADAIAETGGDLGGLTEAVLSYVDAAKRVSLKDLVDPQFGGAIVDTARALNVEMSEIAQTTGEFAFQMDFAGTKSLARVFRTSRMIQKEFGVTGKTALAMVKTTVAQVNEMRKYRQATSGAFDVLVRAQAVAAQLKIPEGQGPVDFAKGGLSFKDWMDNFSPLRARVTKAAAGIYGDISPMDVMSGKLTGDRRGQRALAKALSQELERIADFAAAQQNPISQQIILEADTRGFVTTVEAARRAAIAAARAAETPVETAARIQTTMAKAKSLQDRVGEAAASMFVKREGFDSMENLSKAYEEQAKYAKAMGEHGEEIQDMVEKAFQAAALTPSGDVFTELSKLVDASRGETKKYMQSIGPEEMIKRATELDAITAEMRKAGEEAAQSPADMVTIALEKAIGQTQKLALNFGETVGMFDTGATLFAQAVSSFGSYVMLLLGGLALLKVLGAGWDVSKIGKSIFGRGKGMAMKTARAGTAVDGAGRTVTPVGKALAKARDAGGSLVTRTKRASIVGATNLFESGKSFVGKTFSPVGKLIDGTATLVGKGFAKVKGVGESLMARLEGSLVARIGNLFKSSGSLLTKAFSFVGKSLVRAVTGPIFLLDLGAILTKWVFKGLYKLTGIKEFGAVSDFAGNFSDAFSGALGASVSAVFGGVTAAFKSLFSMDLDPLREWWSDLSTRASQGFSTYVDRMRQFVPEWVVSTKDTLVRWKDAALNGLSKAKDWVGAKIDGFFTGVGKAWSAYKGSWSWLVYDVFGMKETVDAISEFFGGIWDSVSGFFDKMGDRLASWTGEWLPKLKEFRDALKIEKGVGYGEETKTAIVNEIEKSLMDRAASVKKMMDAGVSEDRIEAFRSTMDAETIRNAIETAKGGGVSVDELVEALKEKSIILDQQTSRIKRETAPSTDNFEERVQKTIEQRPAQDRGPVGIALEQKPAPSTDNFEERVQKTIERRPAQDRGPVGIALERKPAAVAAMPAELGNSPIGVSRPIGTDFPAQDGERSVQLYQAQIAEMNTKRLEAIGGSSAQQVVLLRSVLNELREIRRSVKTEPAVETTAAVTDGYPAPFNPALASPPLPGYA